ncbi:hypothetical protein UPYG_G00329460 [Umbra pygmaea]|uniref:Glycine N-acyltransferase-like protein n=1 Tax=Umbra pygmaea TaxID=75934 RepID=A0ABD0WJI2_UMBPY
MERLNKERLKILETKLKDLFPHSMQMYGYIFQKNRIKSDHVHVFVDCWPDFRVVLCNSCEKEGSHYEEMCLFTKDGDISKNILGAINIIDWSKFFVLGTSLGDEDAVMVVASDRKAQGNKVAVCHMMTLQDPSCLPRVDRETEAKISSLDETHSDLVNKTWKFGAEEHSLGKIRNMIRHYPSCCMMCTQKQLPIAWILTYPSGAMGMMYTLPEHRGQGLAKALVISMSRRLHAQGYPVYCFVEEGNSVLQPLQRPGLY